MELLAILALPIVMRPCFARVYEFARLTNLFYNVCKVG
jgi:hypothetical protein